jgi:hypothetical protein
VELFSSLFQFAFRRRILELDDDIKTFNGWNALNLASVSSCLLAVHSRFRISSNLIILLKWNQEDPLSIRYSQIWQMLLMCVSWPFGAAEHTTLPTDLEIMWMTSDFDLKCVCPSGTVSIAYPLFISRQPPDRTDHLLLATDAQVYLGHQAR